MKGSLMNENITGEKSSGTLRRGTVDSDGALALTPNVTRPAATPGKQAQAAPDTPGRRLVSYLLLLIAASLSGLALSACFFPMSQSWLAWFALVPLLPLVRTRARAIWVYLCALAAGSCFFWPALSWMPESNEFMRMAWYGLSLYCSLFFIPIVALLRIIDRRTRLPLVISLPAVWVALEYLRSFLLTGFPWYFLAHTQHDFLAIIQVADLGGAYVVSFLVAMVNGLAFEWLYLNRHVRSVFRLREPDAWLRYTKMPSWVGWQTAAVALALVFTLSYGLVRLRADNFEDGPQIALLQGNIDQNIRNDATKPSGGKELEAAKQAVRDAIQKIAREYEPLCYYAAHQFHKKVDLMIWPETSFPASWRDTARDVPPQDEPDYWQDQINNIQARLREFATQPNMCDHTNLLLGLNAVVLVDPNNKEEAKRFKEYNSALLVKADGSTGGRYDKIHRIPFGEYIPMREEWPWIRKLTPYEGFDYQISQGKEMKRFDLGKYKFGVLICYEDTDPTLARQYGASHHDGPPVDFLVNISNDGWYAGTSEHNEHLAISRFRAVETRKALVRAVNMGISAVIDPNGKVLKPILVWRDGDVNQWDVGVTSNGIESLTLGEWNSFKQKTGVITAVVPIDTRVSLYSLWGDWFASTCAALAAVGVAMAMMPWKRLRPIT